MYKYGTLFRPPMPGAIPRKGLQSVEVFSELRHVSGTNYMVWGIVVYDRELTEKEVNDYELVVIS